MRFLFPSLVILLLGFSAPATDVSSTNAIAGFTQTESAAETEPGMAEATSEQEADWIAAHESNGPEGSKSIPMKQLSAIQISLAICVLLMSGSLAFLAKDLSKASKS